MGDARFYGFELQLISFLVVVDTLALSLICFRLAPHWMSLFRLYDSKVN